MRAQGLGGVPLVPVARLRIFSSCVKPLHHPLEMSEIDGLIDYQPPQCFVAGASGVSRLLQQNAYWIGGTRLGSARFVPPPPGEVEVCMGRCL